MCGRQVWVSGKIIYGEHTKFITCVDQRIDCDPFGPVLVRGARTGQSDSTLAK